MSDGNNTILTMAGHHEAMKGITFGKFLATVFVLALGAGSLLLNRSLPEDGAEITGSIKKVEPFAPVKPRVTEDIFASGSAVLAPLSVVPRSTKPAGSGPTIKVSTAKKRHKPKQIDDPNSLPVIPPPI